MKNKKKHKKEPDVIVTCPRCSEKYVFEKFEDLDKINLKTPCKKCGFLLHEHSFKKIKATNKLLMSGDEHAQKLLNSGNHEEFKKYLELKFGIKDPQPIS